MRNFLKPIKVGKLLLKNRVMYAAMSKYMGDDKGNVTEQFIEYYRTIGKSGVALVVIEALAVDSKWPALLTRQAWIDDDKFIEGLAKVIEAIHESGAFAACQLWHPGETTDDPANPPKTVNELTIEEIKEIQRKYVDAAIRCKKAGADAIEFHLAHNYLPSQFLSPHFNKRTDRYGTKSIEDSLRFSLECLDAMKNKLGDTEIIVKINGDDFVDDGIKPDLAAEASILLEKHGVSLITVNAGGKDTSLTGMSGDGNYEEGWKIPLARTVKEKVSIPVAGCGNIRHPDFAEKILEDGDCDLISIGRGILAEPEWVKKIEEGREKELRYCVSCLHCFVKNPLGTSCCTVNPRAKREYQHLNLVKDGNGRKIVVIGAGPAGMEAAVTFAERGFSVVLFEKSDKIGGDLNLASLPIGKDKLNWIIKSYSNRLEILGVEVRMNTTVTEEIVLSENPYAVVLATGSISLVPPIPGIDGQNVYDVREVLQDIPDVTGKNVIVAGGGMTGLEVARMFKNMGNNVTVLEMMSEPTSPLVEQMLEITYARNDRVDLKYEHKIESIEPDKVNVIDVSTNNRLSFQADMVILSLGQRANDTLYDALKKRFPNTFNIGDSLQPGIICDAVQAGFDVAQTLK